MFAFRTVLRGHGSTGVHIEAGVFPGFHPGHQLMGNELVAEQLGEDSGAEEFLQDVPRNFRRRTPGTVIIQKAIGTESMDVRTEIEVLAESVKGKKNGTEKWDRRIDIRIAFIMIHFIYIDYIDKINKGTAGLKK